MSAKTKFLVFEGMDNCGKSTLLKGTLASYSHAQELKFPKTLPSGALLRINTEKDFEILFTMFELLPAENVYLMDRFIPSNIVYDKVLRDEDVSLSQHYWDQFNERFDVSLIVLTRPHIKSDFIDDRIKLTSKQFNQALDEYQQFGNNYQLLDRDASDQPSKVRKKEALAVASLIEQAMFE